MGAGINRFVLFSAALHLGLLAAVSATWTRPQPLPSALAISLNEISAATTSSHSPISMPTQSPHYSGTTLSEQQALTSDDDAAIAMQSSKQAPDSLPDSLKDASSPAFGGDEEKYQTDLRIPHPNPLPSRDAEAPEGEGTQDLVQQSDAAAVESQLATQLRMALAPYFAYPLMARRNGWEGQVQIGLRVEADGRLSHMRIAHSSGYGALDSAALTTLNRINTLPDAPGWLDGRHFDMVLPVEYRLIDGQT